MATVGLIALAPLSTSSSCVWSGPAGTMTCETDRQNLLAEQPGPVVLVAGVVGTLTALAVLAPWVWAKIVVAVLLTVAMVLGAASVGIFLLPLVAAAWAHAMSSTAPARQT